MSASNRAFTERPDLFQSPLLSAALDRLAHHAHQIVITGDSFRAKARRRAGCYPFLSPRIHWPNFTAKYRMPAR